MSLPNLEELIVKSVQGFGTIFLPEMEKLKKFHVQFEEESTINMESLCRAVKQMPMLQNLMIDGPMSKEETLQLVCEMVVFATSQGKNVVVFEKLNTHCRGIIISRTNLREVEDPSHEQNQTLKTMIIPQHEETYLKEVKRFVKANMKNYETFRAKDYFPLFF